MASNGFMNGPRPSRRRSADAPSPDPLSRRPEERQLRDRFGEPEPLRKRLQVTIKTEQDRVLLCDIGGVRAVSNSHRVRP